MKVVICGAGIAGLALANRMAALGWEVVVLERAPGPRSQGYMIDFFGPGYDAAEAMGLVPAIEAVAYRIDEASLLDEHGRRRAGIRVDRFAAAIGDRLLSVTRPDLERVLRDHLPPGRVDLRFGTSPVRIDDDGDRVRVALAGGADLDADLLVGADGIHSAVRRMVFGDEERFVRYLGFHTAAYRFSDPAVHAAVRGRFCLTDTVDRQMGFYGLRGGEVAAFAVHRTPDPALPGDARAAVRRAYGSLGWVVPGALDRCPPASEVYYDQVAQVDMPAWSRGRVALVGDACFAVSLLAGQGASLAIAGAYVLADQLDRTGSIRAGLERYELLWRPVVAEKQKVARDGARWFLPSSPAQLRLRHLVLRFARLPVLDRVVAGALAGKSSGLVKQLAAHQRPPRVNKLVRALFRAPARLYERNLGWVLGRRFLCLTHTGRRSGRRYRTVLEVVGTGAGEVMVVAGLGRSADWYRNLAAAPAIEVAVGRRKFAPAHRVLGETEAAEVIAAYEHRNRWVRPVVHRLLSKLVGWRYDGSEPARRRLVGQLPIVAFRPASDAPRA